MRRGMGPGWRHGLTAFAIALALGLLLHLGLRLPWTWYHALAAWLVAVNAVTFAYYGYDKGQAGRSGARVPEVVLHALAYAGGTLGAYGGMRLFRHKTIKGRFQIVFWFVVVLQVLLIAAIVYRLLSAA